MENPILAPVGGMVTEMKTSKKQVVETGDHLVTIEY